MKATKLYYQKVHVEKGSGPIKLLNAGAFNLLTREDSNEKIIYFLIVVRDDMYIRTRLNHYGYIPMFREKMWTNGFAELLKNSKQ